MSQMVQVVSMEDVPKRLGSVSFQSKEVSGAQNSVFLFCMPQLPSAARPHAGLRPLPHVRRSTLEGWAHRVQQLLEGDPFV